MCNDSRPGGRYTEHRENRAKGILRRIVASLIKAHSHSSGQDNFKKRIPRPRSDLGSKAGRAIENLSFQSQLVEQLRYPSGTPQSVDTQAEQMKDGVLRVL